MPNLEISPAAQVYYEDDDFTDPWQDSPAMLLQHGFSRSGKFWYNWVPPLGREFRILRPDLRGMGRSTMAEKDYEPDLDTFAGDILHLLDHLEIQRVVFVGESFGGIIGLKFAHAFPQRTRALVHRHDPYATGPPGLAPRVERLVHLGNGPDFLSHRPQAAGLLGHPGLPSPAKRGAGSHPIAIGRGVAYRHGGAAKINGRANPRMPPGGVSQAGSRH